MVFGLLLSASALPSVAFAAVDEAGADSADAGSGAGDEIIVNGTATVEATPLAAAAVEYGNAVQIVTAQEIAATGATNFAEIA
ncbi:MAG: TonB-dependent receptor, partial [Sphingomonadales bacterium]